MITGFDILSSALSELIGEESAFNRHEQAFQDVMAVLRAKLCVRFKCCLQIAFAIVLVENEGRNRSNIQ